MAITKYAASAVIQEAWLAPGSKPIHISRMADGSRGASEVIGMSRLPKTAHRHEFVYKPKRGYLYVRSRAISSRMNDNFDLFPPEEIKKAWGTFIGKPVFVNHHNDDHRRARGVIIDAALHEDTNPDGTPDVWVEVLMEVDAVRFPKLAQAILAGHIDRTSMGTNVEHSQCTACGNIAATPADYCVHIPRLKGMKIRRLRANGGGHEEVIIAEKCVGLSFFENSLLVEDPADPTAFFLGVDDRGLQPEEDQSRQAVAARSDLVTSILLEDRSRWTDEDESKHPRRQDGEFTTKGGEGSGGSDGADEGSSSPSADTSTPQAPKAPKGSGSKEDPIQTDDVDQAAKSLAEGKWVNLSQPRRVCTLLDRLKVEVDKAVKAGEKTKIDLCHVTVSGTNLFCVESKGIPRIQMPQLKGSTVLPGSRAAKEITPNERGEYDLQPAFLQHLRESGVRTLKTEVLAAHLKATQSELNAAKIAGMMESILAGKPLGQEPIFISNDDYIVDGHHRWGGTIAADYQDDKADELTMPVEAIDMDIITLLAEANRFADEWGIPAQGVTASRHSCCEGCAEKESQMFRTALIQPPPDVLGWVPTLNWFIDYSVGKKAPGSRMVDPDAYSYSDIAYGINRARNRGSGLLDEALGRMTRTEIIALVNRIHDEMPLNQISQGSVEHWVYDHADEIIGPRLEGGGGQGTMYFPKGAKMASRTLAYGEQVAPPEVDTLRDEECPVCGSTDAYNGERCLVCNYLTPPDIFADPDLNKAQEVNLRQDKAEANESTGQEALQCPSCGESFGDATADAAPVDPDADVDPADPAADPADQDPVPGDDAMDQEVGDPDKKFPPGKHTDDPQPNDKAEKAVGKDDDEDDDEKDPKKKKPFGKSSKIDPFERLREGEPDGEAPTEVGLKAGDACPKCGEGVLEPAGDATGEPVGSTAAPGQESIEDARVGSLGGTRMGPQLRALAAQQKAISTQNQALLAIASFAGLDDHPAIVALRALADAENPAQPEPEPAAAPAVLVPDVPQGTTEVTAPGASPVTDVAPDATTSVDTVGGAVLTDVGPDATTDVQAPVAGTQEVGDNKIETDVRIGDGDNSTTMFPMEGPFAQKATAASMNDLRQIAAIRLARLRIAAGIAESADDLNLATAIVQSKMDTAAIESEVATLSKVVQASRRTAAAQPRQVLAGVRSVPSFAPTSTPVTAAAEGAPEDDAFLFAD